MSWTARGLRIPSTVDPFFKDHSHKQGFYKPLPLKCIDVFINTLYCCALGQYAPLGPCDPHNPPVRCLTTDALCARQQQITFKDKCILISEINLPCNVGQPGHTNSEGGCEARQHETVLSWLDEDRSTSCKAKAPACQEAGFAAGALRHAYSGSLEEF